jgi:RNA recognition motif-containing protein
MTSFQANNGTFSLMNNGGSDDGSTLFLGDLSVYSTENHIRELFEPYGHIENIRIKKGNSSKPHLCYGFIKFDNKNAAERAQKELNGVMFQGRSLR